MTENVHYRVLIVDDEPLIVELLTTILTSKGHRCEKAHDGIEALQKFSKGRFDCIITDIVMPNMDGITLTREILKHRSNLPIMIMTGFSQLHYRKVQVDQEAINAGASDFISKPFSPAEFLARFNRMMKSHQTFTELKTRQQELEHISTELIAVLQQESTEKIETLKKELEERKIPLPPSLIPAPSSSEGNEPTSSDSTAITEEEDKPGIHNAPNEDPFLLENYYKLVGKKIKEMWNLPEMYHQEMAICSAIIAFIVDRDGKIEKMWFQKKSSDARYDEMALRAVKRADPLPPFPEEIHDSSLEISIHFKGVKIS